MADLKPAETNPWYVLSTLYGPQTGKEIDRELAAKNVALWNVWSCQNLTEEERAKLREAGADVPDAGAWEGKKEEIEKLYKKRFSGMGFGKQELPELPDAKNKIDMSKIAFSHTVVWEKAIFAQTAYFDSATFEQAADFRSAKFERTAYFDSAKFERTAYFSSATFEQAASFSSATFEQAASFSFATFERTAYFSSATFERTVYFISATFEQAADFDSATFERTADFSSATFSGFAYFKGTRFGTDAPLNEQYEISFSDAIFERPTSFRDAAFRQRYPMLDGTVFHDKTQFTAERAFWPTGTQPDPKQAKESCAVLRHVAAKQSLPEDEGFFFRREMKFAGQSGPWPARPLYWLYGLVSDYGHSVWRPVVGLFLLWLICVPFYLGCNLSEMGCLIRQPAEPLLPTLEAMGFSGANIFKFLGFQRAYMMDALKAISIQAPHLQNLAAAQTVLGYILLFFFGLGLRSRFRLR